MNGCRALSLALTVAAAPLWLPMAGFVAAACLVFQGRPVFYTEERSGLGAKPFRLVKFRSMRPGPGSDAERLTRFGKILRASSLDELPQLVHVISGKMSLVGPRPMPVRYLARYSKEQLRRFEVPPGITGWAQIHGRNQCGWDEKFAYDAWYAEHRSVALDLKILLKTALLVATARGISAEGAATAVEFEGSAHAAGSATSGKEPAAERRG